MRGAKHIRQVVLHVGFWKCGSTTLQESLRAAAADLAGYGLIYPDAPTLRQRRVIDAFHGDPASLFWNRNNGITDPAVLERNRAAGLTFLNRHMHLARGKTLLLSSEHFIAMPEPDLARLRDHLRTRTDKLRVVVYVRHPVAHARSAVQERVKQGVTTLAEERKTPRAYPLRREIEKLVAVFGREGVTVRPLDRAQLADRQISRDFLAVAAPGLAPDDAIRDIVSNRSLSMEALALADALAASEPAFCGTGRNPGRGSRDWLHDIAGAPVTLEAAWEDLIDDLGRADLAWLKQDWGIVLPRPKRAARDGLWSPKAVSSLARTLNRMSLAAGP